MTTPTPTIGPVGERRCEPRALLRAILKAQSTADPFDDLHAHREAVDAGQSMVPPVREAIIRCAGAGPLKPGQLARFTALALVLRDVDEAAARDLYRRLRAKRTTDAVYVARLKTITSFTLEDFDLFEAKGVPIFVAHSLGDTAGKGQLLQEWLATLPGEDVEGIRRVFVIDKQDHTYWGLYLRVLATVTLIWRGPSEAQWWSKLLLQFAFFHEVGHHVSRDLRETTDEESDEEALADAYALAQMRILRPFLLFGPLGSFLTILSRTSLGRREPSEMGSPAPGDPELEVRFFS